MKKVEILNALRSELAKPAVKIPRTAWGIDIKRLGGGTDVSFR